MEKNELLLKLEEIFRDVFDDDTISLCSNTSADDIEDWDSLMHINLIAAIENEFNIKFTLNEIIELKDVGSMVDMIEKKL